MERAARSRHVWTPLLPAISDRNRNKSKISEFVIGLRRTARRTARNSGRTAHIGTCSFVSLLQVQTKRSVQHRRPGTALLSARGRHRSSGRQRGRGHLIPARLHRKTGQFADSGLPSPQSAKKDFFNTIRQKLSVEECPGWVCAVQRRRFPAGANPIRQPLQPEAIEQSWR